MPDCKSCGAWFAAVNKREELCPTCEKALARLAGYAAPVVRCKDCVHWDDDPDTYGADDGPKGKCMKSFETMCADDFCSYGERKDGGDG